MAGRFVPRPSPTGRRLCNLLLLALRRIRDVGNIAQEEEIPLPDPLHIFLLASGDPNEMSHGTSALCQAFRAGEARAVSLLLRYRAHPTLCEPGHPDPIFIAIRGEFPQCVRLLLNHRANVDACQDYVATTTSSSNDQLEIFLRSRSIYQAAVGCPRILLMLQDAAHKVDDHSQWHQALISPFWL